MNVMQALSDFQQNLRHSAPAASHSVEAASSLAKQRGSQNSIGTTAASAKAANLRGDAVKGGMALADAASGTSSGSGSTTITANDFLQLLVAEMKNQDPTADQDPNAYIDQLVQVNSLQQLIAINQDLTGVTGSSASSDEVVRAEEKQPLGSAAGSPAAAISSALSSHPQALAVAPLAEAGTGVRDLERAGDQMGAGHDRDTLGGPQVWSERAVQPFAANPAAIAKR